MERKQSLEGAKTESGITKVGANGTEVNEQHDIPIKCHEIRRINIIQSYIP